MNAKQKETMRAGTLRITGSMDVAPGHRRLELQKGVIMNDVTLIESYETLIEKAEALKKEASAVLQEAENCLLLAGLEIAAKAHVVPNGRYFSAKGVRYLVVPAQNDAQPKLLVALVWHEPSNAFRLQVKVALVRASKTWRPVKSAYGFPKTEYVLIQLLAETPELPAINEKIARYTKDE